jgi:hypothetical protein
MIVPYPKGIAHHLSRPQREILIQHVVGPREFRTGEPATLTVNAMRDTGLLKGMPFLRPKHTELTALGRQVACIVLGEYADRLLMAGPDYETRLLNPKGRVPRPTKSKSAAGPAPTDECCPSKPAPTSSNG